MAWTDERWRVHLLGGNLVLALWQGWVAWEEGAWWRWFLVGLDLGAALYLWWSRPGR